MSAPGRLVSCGEVDGVEYVDVLWPEGDPCVYAVPRWQGLRHLADMADEQGLPDASDYHVIADQAEEAFADENS